MSSFIARRAATAPQFARAFSSTSARPVAKINIIGTLGSTPEITTTGTGREFFKYSVASNVNVRGETRTSWFRISGFNLEGNRRDFYQSLPKGSLVFVEADVSFNSYTDKDGNNREALNMVQRNLEVLRRPSPRNNEEEE